MNIETNEVRTISEKVRTTLEKIPDPKKRYNGKAVLVSLKFNNTERSDDGLYQCVANNKVSEPTDLESFRCDNVLLKG